MASSRHRPLSERTQWILVLLAFALAVTLNLTTRAPWQLDPILPPSIGRDHSCD